MNGTANSSNSTMNTSRESSLPTFTARVQFDPTRSPEWRWDRAFRHIFDELTFSSIRDDEATGRAVKFRQALTSCRTPEQRSELHRSDPAMFAAHELYKSTSRKRYEVEARLLAKQTPAEVAQFVGLSEDVIQVYEAVFFNVAGFLTASGWITGKAIGIGPYTAMNVPEFGRFLKTVAFQAGLTTLDALLSTVVDDDGLFTTANVTDLSTAEGRNATRMALLVLAQFAHLRHELIAEMVRIRDLISRYEREYATERRIADDLLQVTEELDRPLAPAPSHSAPSSDKVVRDTSKPVPSVANGKVA
jgi:hypothetical protein